MSAERVCRRIGSDNPVIRQYQRLGIRGRSAHFSSMAHSGDLRAIRRGRTETGRRLFGTAIHGGGSGNLAILGAIGRAAHQGAIVKGGLCLEALARYCEGRQP